ncbi:MAG TPA: VWA domain-containing protein [Kineosporiaceae bacterium]|nr:VWA domain-containing protein [Kineosporiaceae bacterium]
MTVTVGAPDLALAGFARALRAAGLRVTPDRTAAFVEAAAAVGAVGRQGLYWAGRAALCSDPDEFARYDVVFGEWFGGELPGRGGNGRPRAVPARTSITADADGSQGPSRPDRERETEIVRARASGADVLRHRDVGALSPAERALLAQLFATLDPRAPRRRAVRRSPWHSGDLDARRTLREELRRGGEPGRLRYRRRRTRPRRVVLVVDVSGSMTPYADALLRLAHVWVRSAPRSTEVFTVGTRLTRVTVPLRGRDAERALREAGEAVPDWSGGTRLGEVLKAFLDRWGARGTARGAVVVLFSDGWERGTPGLLAEQMARLHRLAHRVVWVNPHRGKAGYRPVQGGIVAALPHVDDFVAGHSLATFAELLEVVARA